MGRVIAFATLFGRYVRSVCATAVMAWARLEILEDAHQWGTMRAAMVEGPDRIAIQIVEAR
jgi:hypothetical protein